jgi:hypothetical protein
LETLGFDQPNAQNAVAGLLDLKRSIAFKLWELGIPSGTINATTTTVTGAGSNAWTKVATAWLVTAPQQPLVATMLGFPDLEPPSTVNDPRGSAVNHGGCVPVDGQNGRGPGVSGWTQPTCPPSNPVQVASWPVCSGEGTIYDGDFVEIQASAFFRENVGRALNNTCSEAVSGTRDPSCDTALQNYVHIQEYAVGRMPVLKNVCSSSQYLDYNVPGNIGSYWPLTRQWNNGGNNLYCCQR